MIFRRELAGQVMSGEKTQTRRRMSDNPRSPWFRERCAFQVGEDYAVQPGRGKRAIGRVLVEQVRAEPLGKITHLDAIAEGFANPRAHRNPTHAFAETWRAINGAFDSAEIVWVLTFRRLG